MAKKIPLYMKSLGEIADTVDALLKTAAEAEARGDSPNATGAFELAETLSRHIPTGSYDRLALVNIVS